jgi:hypothetical protein
MHRKREARSGLCCQNQHTFCCRNLQVPGFATFEAMVRIFRVVRVFRVFRLGKRLKDEVLSCVLTVTFTLLAIIVTGAGVFYEIETNFSVCVVGACAGPALRSVASCRPIPTCGPVATRADGGF